MRILWIAERFPPHRGGVARSAARQAAAMAERAERVDVLTLDERAAQGMALGERCGKAFVHRLGRAGRDDESLQLLFEAALALAGAQRHALVHGFYAGWAGYTAVLAARRLGLPSVVSLRGNDVDRGLFSTARLPMLSWTLEHATALAAVTEELAERVRAFCGPRDKLFVVPNSVDGERFAPGPGSLAEAGGAARPWVGFSGEARFKKGLPVLLELAEDLERRGRGTVFLIGGVRREEEEALERWRRGSPAASRLVCLPYTRDDAALTGRYRAMDLLVFPSLWDGMPNALLEAMACGKPVVAAAVGGLKEAVEPGGTGVLVAPERLDRFSSEVAELLDDSPRLARLGQAARERALERYGARAEADALWCVYEAAR